MNETTTMSDLSEDQQEFAAAIIDIVESKYEIGKQQYQEGKIDERVALADIPNYTKEVLFLPYFYYPSCHPKDYRC